MQAHNEGFSAFKPEEIALGKPSNQLGKAHLLSKNATANFRITRMRPLEAMFKAVQFEGDKVSDICFGTNLYHY